MSTHSPVEVSCKVLVVGGGLAAASAARSAVCFADGVVVASKGPFGRSGASPRRATAVSQQIVGAEFGGNPAVMADSYVIDILEAGHYLNDQHLVDLITEICYDQVSWSEWFGFQVRAEEYRRRRGGTEGYHAFMGAYPRYTTPGHSFPRTIPFEGTPEALLAAHREALDLWGVQVLDRVTITRLLTAGDRVVGATGFDVQTGQPYRIRARSTVLCAGGAGVRYHERSGEGETTGDSYALAYHAGAPLANMEFVQFSLYPAGANGLALAHNDDLLYLGLGGTLVNNRGERFLQQAMLLIDQIRLERAPVANLVSEVHHQVASGLGPVRSPGGELADQPAALQFLRTLQHLNRAGYDWRLDGLEWTFGVERLLGGLKVDYRIVSPLAGLYGNGEAATGAAGADALPGFGTAYTMSGGFQAGAMAARAAVSAAEAELPLDQVEQQEAALRALGGGEPISASELADRESEVRALGWKARGIWRNEDDLRAARERYGALRHDLAHRSAPDLDAFRCKLGLENTALTGCLVATAALHHTENAWAAPTGRLSHRRRPRVAERGVPDRRRSGRGPRGGAARGAAALPVAPPGPRREDLRGIPALGMEDRSPWAA